MKYVADDGKEFAKEEDCFAYERELKEKETFREREDTFARIQNDLLILNEEVKKYKELGGDVIFMLDDDEKLQANKVTRYGYSRSYRR